MTNHIAPRTLWLAVALFLLLFWVGVVGGLLALVGG